MSPETQNLLVTYFTNLCGHLLNKFGEFFPVAAGVNDNGEIVPLSVYFGEEHPTSQKMIAEFELAFRKLTAENKFTLFAIGLDVVVTAPHLPGKTDALEIRCQSKDKRSVNIYLPYKRDERNLVVFLDPYKKQGSLDIF